MKLYPPILEGTIPAFHFNNEVREKEDMQGNIVAKKITALKVPYEMNRAVSNADFSAMELKMKMIQSTSNKWQTVRSYKVDKINKIAYFDMSDLRVEITRFINIGQFYKVQMAYVQITSPSETGEPIEEIGYYSTVATVKYTSRPRVVIEGLKVGDNNANIYTYIGSYSQSKSDYEVFEYYLNSPEVLQILSSKDEEIQKTSDNYEKYKNGEISEFPQTFSLKRTKMMMTTNNSDSYGSNEGRSSNSGGGGGGGGGGHVASILRGKGGGGGGSSPRISNASYSIINRINNSSYNLFQTLEEDEAQMEAKKAAEEECRIEILQGEKSLEELKKELAELENELNAKNAELNEKLDAFNNEPEVLALKEQLEKLYEDLDNLEAQNKDTRDVERKIADTITKIDDKRKEYISALGTDIEELKFQIAFKKEQIYELEKEQESLEATATKLTAFLQAVGQIVSVVRPIVENIVNTVADAITNGVAEAIVEDNPPILDENPEIDLEAIKEELQTNEDMAQYTEYINQYCEGQTNMLVPYSFPYGGDSSEKAYMYRFDVYDKDYNIIDTTDWQIHDSSTDLEIYESHDIYKLRKDLSKNEVYYIQYRVRTSNNMEVVSEEYRLVQWEGVGPSVDLEIKPILDFENGRVLISLLGPKNEYGGEKFSTGSFRIMRTSDESNYLHWEQIADFAIYGQKLSTYKYSDYNIKHGTNYIYSVQRYNEYDISSDRIKTEKIFVDFEHAFLFDGERQLKIKYNPKVSSFKATKLEAKMDTIGSKYPFILRNGNVDYKEFPISGLISYKTDEDFCFVNKDFLIQDVGTINLTGENITDERNFKMEVLKWLTNGKPKLFKSPGEGNFIIRLMNVSMTPNDTVNRMLHTFNGTAYEIAEFNYENLVKYGFINSDITKFEQILWKSVELNKWGLNMNPAGGSFNLIDIPKRHIDDQSKEAITEYAVGIKFEGMMPGDRIYINDEINHGITVEFEDQVRKVGYIITIGATGQYNIDIQEGIKIKEVVYLSGLDRPDTADYMVSHQGLFTYAYMGVPWDAFNNIMKIQMFYNPVEQFRGPYDYIENSEIYGMNIFEWISDVRISAQNIQTIKFTCKDLYQVYQMEGKLGYYSDPNCNIPIELNQWDVIYEIISSNSGERIGYIDGYSGLPQSEYCTKISLNGNIMDLSETYEYTFNKVETSDCELYVGNGVICEMGYQQVISRYSFEVEDNNEYTDFFVKNIREIYTSRYSKIYNKTYICEDFNGNIISGEGIDSLFYCRFNRNIAWQIDIENGDNNLTLLKAYDKYLQMLEDRMAEERER